ncbi:MAG: hypothetical protein WA705_02800 [Candidatus Ozemobacteraceae bacterium]
MKKMNWLSFSHLLLLIGFFGTFSLFAADNLSGDFSGQPLGKILAGIAKTGGITIVGNFPDQKVPCVRFSEEVYYEEALNLVTKCCGLVMRRIGYIWLVIPDDQEQRLDSLRKVTIFPEFRSPLSFEEPLRLLLYPQMKFWFLPLTGAIEMFGKVRYLSELKEIVYTLDAPIHRLQIDTILKKGTDQTVIASASVTTPNGNPFRLTCSTPATPSESLDWQGSLEVNDDGILHGTYQFEICSSGERMLFSQEFSGKDKQWTDHVFEFSGTSMTASLRGTVVPRNIKSLPLAEEMPLLAGEPVAKKETLTEIHHGETITLKKPLIFEKAPISQVIEQLAAMNKIPIICDADVSGTVSVYCFEREINLVDLISAIAVPRGYSVLHHGNGLIVGEIKTTSP